MDEKQLPPFTTLLAVLALLAAGVGFAKPSGFSLKSGDAKIIQPNSESLLIQSGKQATIDWDSFSIAHGEIVRFSQADQSSSVINRVLGSTVSDISGQLLSNGAVYLINPNGVVIGPSGHVETAGFLASTLDLFKQGPELRLRGESRASVINEGIIHCPVGDILLIGRTVENSGEMIAENGMGQMLSGYDVLVRPRSGPAILIHSGDFDEEFEENPYALAIRHSGKVSGKEIYISSDRGVTEIAGSTVAKGGVIHLLGDEVRLSKEATVDVSHGVQGGTILVGGDYRGANAGIKNAEKVLIEKGAKLYAQATEKGDGGKVIIWADKVNQFSGEIDIRGGKFGGDGGFAEISGKTLQYEGDIHGSSLGKSGTVLFDPTNITIQNSTSSGNFSSGQWVATGDTSSIAASTIQSLLAGGTNVVLTTSSIYPGVGNITWNAGNDITWNANSSLTLIADTSIYLGSNITNTSMSSSFTSICLVANGINGGSELNNAIRLENSTLSSNASQITLLGKNPNSDSSSLASAILINGASSVTTDSGTILIAGEIGQEIEAQGHGVLVNTTGSISSNTGRIYINGKSSCTGGDESDGVRIAKGRLHTLGTLFFGATSTIQVPTIGAVVIAECSASDIAPAAGVNISSILETDGNIVFQNCKGNDAVQINASMTIGGNLIATNAITGKSSAGFHQISGVLKASSVQINSTSDHYGALLSGGEIFTETGAVSIYGMAPIGLNVAGGSVKSENGSIQLSGYGTNSHGVMLAANSVSSKGSVSVTGYTLGTIPASLPIAIFGNLVTPGDLTFNSAIGATSATVASTGDLTLNGSLDAIGNSNIALASGNLITLAGNVGSYAPPSSFILNGANVSLGSSLNTLSAGALQIHAPQTKIQFVGTSLFSTTGSLIFNGDLIGVSPTHQSILLSAGSGEIELAGNLGSKFTPLGAVSISSGAKATFNGSEIYATSFIDNSVPLFFQNKMMIDTSSAGGNIRFGAPINGPGDLTLISGNGDCVFQSNVNSLGALKVALANAVSFSTNSLSAKSVHINDGISTTIAYPGITSFTTDEEIYFGGLLRGSSVAIHHLSLNAGGQVTFNGNIGSNKMGNLTIANAASVQFGPSFDTINANSFVISENIPSAFAKATVATTTGDLAFGGSLTGEEFTLNCGNNGHVSFGGNIHIAKDLSIANATSASFDSASIEAGSLQLIGPIPALFSFEGDVAITTNGNILFGSTLEGASQNMTFSANNGSLALNGSISKFHNFHIASGSAVQFISPSIDTSALTLSIPATFLGEASLNAEGNILFEEPTFANALIITNANDVIFAKTLAADSLLQEAGSGSTLFNGELNLKGDLSFTGMHLSLNKDVQAHNILIDNKGIATVASNISAKGDLSIAGALILNNHVQMDVERDATFAHTIDGDFALTVNGSNLLFANAVGKDTTLLSLVARANQITLSDNVSVSEGPLSFSGNTLLTQDTIFTNSGSKATTFDNLSSPSSCTIYSHNTDVTVNGSVDLGGNLTIEAGSNLAIAKTVFAKDVTLSTLAKSIYVDAISAENISLSPSSGSINNSPTGILVLKGDLSAPKGRILIDAHRFNTSNTATILGENDLAITADTFKMGQNESMNISGNIEIVCTTSAALGDIKASNDLIIDAPTIFLNTKDVSHKLHFTSGGAYSRSGKIVPSTANLIEDSFQLKMLFGASLSLGVAPPVAPPATLKLTQSLIYRETVAGTEFFDMQPLYLKWPPKYKQKRQSP